MVMENLASVRTIFQFLNCLIQKQGKWCRDTDRKLPVCSVWELRPGAVCVLPVLRIPSMSCPNCWLLSQNWGLLGDHCLNSMSGQETRPMRPKGRLTAGVGKMAAHGRNSWSSSMQTTSMRLSLHVLLCCLLLREAHDVVRETHHASF